MSTISDHAENRSVDGSVGRDGNEQETTTETIAAAMKTSRVRRHWGGRPYPAYTGFSCRV